MAVDRNRYNELKAKNFARNTSNRPLLRAESKSEIVNQRRAKRLESNGRIHKDLPIYQDSIVSRQIANEDLASARQVRKDMSRPGNDYQYGTREEVNAQHNARYRDLRRAFGMSAG